jgi:hypothetical protein
MAPRRVVDDELGAGPGLARPGGVAQLHWGRRTAGMAVVPVHRVPTWDRWGLARQGVRPHRQGSIGHMRTADVPHAPAGHQDDAEMCELPDGQSCKAGVRHPTLNTASRPTAACSRVPGRAGQPSSQARSAGAPSPRTDSGYRCPYRISTACRRSLQESGVRRRSAGQRVGWPPPRTAEPSDASGQPRAALAHRPSRPDGRGSPMSDTPASSCL